MADVKIEDKLILLKRINPTEYEVHRNEIDRTKNLLFTTTDEDFANRIVNRFNSAITGREVSEFFEKEFETRINKAVENYNEEKKLNKSRAKTNE